MKSSLRLLTSAVIVAGGAAAAYLASEPAIKRWQAKTEQQPPEAASTQQESAQPANPLAKILPANISVHSSGDQQLLQAIARLEQRESVTARIRQEAYVGPVAFYGAGTYRQQGRGTRRHVRWLLESQRDGVHATLLQVSDGESLWTDRNLSTGRQIEWVNLWQVRRQAKASATTLVSSAAEPADSAPFSPHFAANYGGLPSLLESLREHFEFTQPRSFRFGNQQVLGMIGRWRPEALGQILVDTSDLQEDQIDYAILTERLSDYLATKSLPAHMPHHLLLLLGQTDQFPYLIDYRSASDALAEPGIAEADLFQLSSEPLSRLEFVDVEFNLPINSGEFIYSPPQELDRIDGTTNFIKRTQQRTRLKLVRQQAEQVAKRSGGQLH